MNAQPSNPLNNDGLPDIVRVRAQKGFRAHVNGQFGVVNVGDVVPVAKTLAYELRAAGKAVMTSDAEHRADPAAIIESRRQKRLQNAAADPSTKQIAVLTDAVNALQKTVETMTKSMEQMQRGMEKLLK